MQQTSGELKENPLTEQNHSSKRRTQKGLSTVLTIVITIFLSALASYTILYFALPKPMLSIQSDYHHEGLAAGSNGTIFYLNGRNFSPNTTIALYLDEKRLANQSTITSAQDGTFRTELMVTTNWTPGKHKISVQNDTNRIDSSEFIIVQPGEAHTPGPANAPANDSSFEFLITFQGRIENTAPFTWQQEFDIRGKENPKGGSVCTDADTGKPQRISSSTKEMHVRATKCQGNYQSGQITYDQIIIADQVERYSEQGTVYCSLPPHRSTSI
ncbi:hypothetical protein [Ktedonospora formicarum]|uniref:IPT/TIG domain-containing protein n=1 Tax=Ktedonospora formicarum TaxID=2778364 RepID=A0A8J3HZY3_9CHLR|nr:hypothetical protein [Ktedonospora formicarum]GHO43578.1 hypothetical protein KSX_17410 [Ktedonospora formicarum]